MKVLLLIHGKLRTGKDEMGLILTNMCHFHNQPSRIVKFADALKADCEKHLAPVLNLVTEVTEELIGNIPKDHPDYAYLTELANRIISSKDNWYDIKTGLTRLLLQTVGTEFARKANDDVWVNRMVESIQADTASHVFICTDMRFENECFLEEKFTKEARANMKFVRIKIIRGTNDDVGVAGHASEAGLPDEYFDYVIDNNGTLRDYHDSIRSIFHEVMRPIL